MQNLSARWIFLIMAGVGIAGFIVGQVLEVDFGIQGCRLCHIERWMMLAGGIFSLLTWMTWTSLFGLFAAYNALFVWIAGCFTTLYHVGIQYHLFHVPTFCAVKNAETLSEFLSTPKISCDQRTLELFSIPSSVYLSILFAVLSVVSIYVLRKRSV